MDLEIIILSEVRKRKANIIWYCLDAESKKKKKEFICKTDSQTSKINLWLPKGKKWGSDKLKIYTPLYIKYITNKEQGPIM